MSLIHNPVKWSASIVSTWGRFWFFGVFLIAILAGTVGQAASFGWRAAIGGVIFVSAFQLMMLYALRRLFLVASGQSTGELGAEVRTRHLFWLLALFVAVLTGLGLFMRFGSAV
jgi:hypothetical protein